MTMSLKKMSRSGFGSFGSFGSLHPIVPRKMVMVLDLDKTSTMIDLQDQVEGRIKKVVLYHWAMIPVTPPYFQLRFSQGIEIKTLTFGANIISNAIQVPSENLGNPLEIPVIRELMFSRRFTVELFGCDGLPLTVERCVLWFIIELE